MSSLRARPEPCGSLTQRISQVMKKMREQQQKMNDVSNEIQMLTQQLKEAGLFGQASLSPSL